MGVLVLDSNFIIRKGLKLILSENNNAYDVYEASSVKEALSILANHSIDLVLTEIKLEKESVLDFVKDAKKKYNSVKFILLTHFISEVDFIKSEEIGLDGYILKDALEDEIIFAIKTVMRGKKYYAPSIIQYKLETKISFSINGLTSREKQILMEVSKGLSNMDIAKKLFLSESTVKKHVSSILGKLDLSKRSQVAYYMNSTIVGG